ncbi:hypothetical protein EVB27_153 [Rhizobium phage RHph_TM16]|nr:hypothetical protein EVB27_153 [Rhizobium phage RHph_TM16]
MAVKALVLSTVLTHVLSTDPSRKVVTKPVDPEDASKGTKTEIVIDADATVFSYKPLDVFLMGYIYDRASILSQSGDGSTDMKTRLNETNIDAVRFGVTSIANFLEADGSNHVQFKMVKRVVNGREYDAIPDEVLIKLDAGAIGELAFKIKEASSLQKEDEKN